MQNEGAKVKKGAGATKGKLRVVGGSLVNKNLGRKSKKKKKLANPNLSPRIEAFSSYSNHSIGLPCPMHKDNHNKVLIVLDD